MSFLERDDGAWPWLNPNDYTSCRAAGVLTSEKTPMFP